MRGVMEFAIELRLQQAERQGSYMSLTESRRTVLPRDHRYAPRWGSRALESSSGVVRHGRRLDIPAYWMR